MDWQWEFGARTAIPATRSSRNCGPGPEFRSVLAHLEEEVGAALMPRGGRRAVLRLLREVLLYRAGELLVHVDAAGPVGHGLERPHEVPGKDRVPVLAGIGHRLLAA